MDLAEQIIASNSDDYELDDIGLPIADTVDYLVARALYRNTLSKEEDYEAPLLHKRLGVVYLGKDIIKETRQNMYILAMPQRKIKENEVYEFWEILKSHLPELDKSKIIVSRHLAWDLKSGELQHYDEDLYKRAV